MTTNHTTGGRSSHDIVKKWAEDNNVQTVNRSYGEQTTAPVSVAALENLVRSALRAEREAMANQEPVAWRYTDARGHFRYRGYVKDFDKTHAILKPVKLFASPVPIPEGWQPIETAPKDGTKILAWVGWAWNGRLPFVGTRWVGVEDGRGYWMNESYNGSAPPNFAPTHWDEIPAAPKHPTSTESGAGNA